MAQAVDEGAGPSRPILIKHCVSHPPASMDNTSLPQNAETEAHQSFENSQKKQCNVTSESLEREFINILIFVFPLEDNQYQGKKSQICIRNHFQRHFTTDTSLFESETQVRMGFDQKIEGRLKVD